MERLLKYLIPEDVNHSLNSNPSFQWLVIVFTLVVGAFLVSTGIGAVKTKRLKGKNGRVFEGTTARVLGIVYIILGVLLPVVVIATKVLK